MFILLVTLAYSQTVWQDTATGQSYDWTSLAKSESEYYEVIDYTNPFTPSTYNFNFGSELPDTCSGQKVMASETIEFVDGWMASCSILGRKNMQKVSSTPNGIKISFQGGDICFDNNEITNRKITFELVCSSKEGEWQVTESAYNNYCKVGLVKNSKAGCPLLTSRTWLWVLGTVFFLAGLVALIWYYGRAYEFEMKIPFKEFFSTLFTQLAELGDSIVSKAKSLINRASVPKKNYEMV